MARIAASRVSKRAALAAGSRKAPPGASRAETPRSGMSRRIGPGAALSFAAMKAAMARHSSGVVRIRVTLALWRWKWRPAKRSGMVSGAQKFTMSSGAGGADLREAGAGDGAEAVGAGGEDAADELVGDLGGGGVDHALEHAAVGEHLQRAAAGAGGVEDERVVGGAQGCRRRG